MDQAMRTIKYNFGPNFFLLNRIGATIKFRVGDKPLKKLTLVENHYFKDKLIKAYSF